MEVGVITMRCHPSNDAKTNFRQTNSDQIDSDITSKLAMKKLSARWMPANGGQKGDATVNFKAELKCLEKFKLDPKDFLRRVLTISDSGTHRADNPFIANPDASQNQSYPNQSV